MLLSLCCRRPRAPQAQVARERLAAERRRKHAQRMLRAKYLQAKSEIAEQVRADPSSELWLAGAEAGRM